MSMSFSERSQKSAMNSPTIMPATTVSSTELPPSVRARPLAGQDARAGGLLQQPPAAAAPSREEDPGGKDAGGGELPRPHVAERGAPAPQREGGADPLTDPRVGGDAIEGAGPA